MLRSVLRVCAWGVAILLTTVVVAEESPLDLFEQRIMPIFRSPRPSSCVQCHLSSVDLKEYILPSHEKTFASLRDSGLINLEKPAESKILQLISMGERDLDKGAKLLHAKTREAEYRAFAAWIAACCADESLRHTPALDKAQVARPDKSDEVIRHARKDRLLDSFERNIWSQRMRCFPCHTPHELDSKNPQHQKPIQRHRELVKQYGQRINIFRETPLESMRALMVSSQKRSTKRLPLLNVEEPRQSLLVLKPTSKLPAKGPDGKFAKPSSLAPVSHMGGLKMHIDDQSYKAFLAWLTDYSRVVQGTYESVDDLPLDNWLPTKNIVRLRDTPEDWAVGTPVQILIHAWDAEKERWSEEAVAFTQGTVTPRHFVNGALFLFSGSKGRYERKQQPAALKEGPNLLKVYVDQTGLLRRQPTAFLADDDYVGAIEIQARWREGFRDAELVSVAALKK